MANGRLVWNLDHDFFAALSHRSGGRDLKLLLSLMARNSLWIDPAVANAVPVAYPKTARVIAGRQRVGEVIDGVRLFTNQPAIHAFFSALGSHERWFAGANVCHIHGEAVHDPRHFTRLSNLVTLPRTLSRFSDSTGVEDALKFRAFELYGYPGPNRHPPARPPMYPDDWARPVTPPDVGKTIARLSRARDRNPMYSKPRQPPGAAQARLVEDSKETAEDRRWTAHLALDFLETGTIMPRHAPARDLDAEFWMKASWEKVQLRALVRWVVEHSYFAPTRVVEAVPVPYPLARRVFQNTGEKPHQFKDGAWLVNNTPAARALLISMGLPVSGAVFGATVDHAWEYAAYLPGHYAHLAGLVLVPLALASLVDAPPMRALLQRHIFERTGYQGPEDKTPPTSRLMPERWPELMHLTRERQDKAIAKLATYRETRPGFYPDSAPGA